MEADRGGDAPGPGRRRRPARFGAAAAAYAALRTSFGRGEALADLGAMRGRHRSSGLGRRRFRWPRAGSESRTGLGRGRRLALRAGVVLGVTVTAVIAVGWTPATIGVTVGALTWGAVTSRANLRP